MRGCRPWHDFLPLSFKVWGCCHRDRRMPVTADRDLTSRRAKHAGHRPAGWRFLYWTATDILPPLFREVLRLLVLSRDLVDAYVEAPPVAEGPGRLPAAATAPNLRKPQAAARSPSRPEGSAHAAEGETVRSKRRDEGAMALF